MAELRDYILMKTRMAEEDLLHILSCFQEKALKKNRFLLKCGHTATAYYFVKKGALRIYFNKDEKDITGWIALENEFFTELNSLTTRTPSRFNIQAIEDTFLLTISSEQMEQLYQQYPQWQQFGRLVWEKAFLQVIEGVINHQILTAEERYFATMQQPGLLQKVPLKHLSSYLGITPTSLSRLRKKIR